MSMSPWSRLQALSCAHATQIYCATHKPINGTMRLRSVSVPEVIDENAQILGRGDEEEMKARVFWYITYYPDLFNACAKVWNSEVAR